MPNTGKPSKDCHLCRSRRVKCDLGRPGCQRCVKYGVECPGYRDQQELVFRNSTPTNIKKRKKRTQQAASAESSTRDNTSPPPRQTSPPETETVVSTPSEYTEGFFFDQAIVIEDFEDELIDERALALPRSLSEHWTTHSVPILLNVYSTLDFLQNMYRRGETDGPLTWAAHLFTRTYVTNLRHPTAKYKASVTETERELGTYLGKTLSAVSSALKTPEGAFRDDVLATVWILSNYELLIGSIGRMTPMSPWHLHARGLYSILKTRGTKPLYTEAGRQCFWPAFNMVQIQCLLASTECPPESEEWLDAIKDAQGMVGLGINVCIFINKIAHIQSRILGILSKRDFISASAEYRHLVGTMSEAEDMMSACFESEILSPHPADPYMLNMYHSACIKGFNFLFLYANFLTHHLTSPIPMEELMALRLHCLRMIRNAAQEIVASLPSTLNPLQLRVDKSPRVLFDALKLIWPLTSVYVIPTVPEEMRLRAETALRLIGREIGVKQALRVYPGALPLPPECRQPLQVGDVMT